MQMDKRRMAGMTLSGKELREGVLQALINQALPDALLVHDHSGRFIEANHRACESLGYSRTELLSMSVTDIEQDFDLAGAQEVWSRIRPGATTVIWGRQRRKDGSIFPVEIQFGLLAAGGERIYVGVVRDISDRLANIDTFLRHEARFEATFEQAAVGIAMVAPDGKWIRVNRRLCDVLGYGHSELLAKTFQELTHPEDLATELDFSRRLLAGEIETYTMEKRYLRKDGRSHWIKLTRSLVRTPDGKPDYLVAIVEDIQPRKNAEAEAIRSARHFQNVFENSSNGIAITDWQGRFQQSNRAFRQLVGYREGELATMDFSALVHADDRAANGEALGRLRAGEQGSIETIHRYVRKGGQPIWVRRVVSAFPESSGKPAYLLNLVTDSSECRAGLAEGPEDGQAAAAVNATRTALVCDYILANIERPISLAELERFSGMSRRSLQYAFQEEFGCTPMQWLRACRLDQARRLLGQAGPGMTVTHAALACGFTRLGAFASEYCERFGELPSATLRRGRPLLSEISGPAAHWPAGLIPRGE